MTYSVIMFSFYFWVQFGKLLMCFALFPQKKEEKWWWGSKEWEETEKQASARTEINRLEQTVIDLLGLSGTVLGMLWTESGSDYLGEKEVSEVKVKVWPMTSNCLLRSPARKLTAQADSLALLGHFSSYILTTGYLFSADFVLIFLLVFPTYQLNFCTLKQQQQQKWSEY